MERRRSDRWLIAGVVLTGLAVWFVYCAVQPHDFWSLANEDDRLATFFGWDAPGMSARDGSIPDRFWIVWLGWALLSVIAGWFRPRHPLAIGLCAVLPTWILYLPTAPRSDDGLWAAGVFFLPFTVAGFTALAWLSGTVRTRFVGEIDRGNPSA